MIDEDTILRRLASLPLAAPDAARATRIVERCRMALLRARGKAPTRRIARYRWTAPALTALALVYFTQVVRLALLAYGI